MKLTDKLSVVFPLANYNPTLCYRFQFEPRITKRRSPKLHDTHTGQKLTGGIPLLDLSDFCSALQACLIQGWPGMSKHILLSVLPIFRFKVKNLAFTTFFAPRSWHFWNLGQNRLHLFFNLPLMYAWQPPFGWRRNFCFFGCAASRVAFHSRGAPHSGHSFIKNFLLIILPVQFARHCHLWRFGFLSPSWVRDKY